MSVLLDTHVWIWWVLGQAELPENERSALGASAKREPPLLSAISLWEAQMLHAEGRLTLRLPFSRWLAEASRPDVVSVVPLTVEVVLAVHDLPDSFHGDPADRIIVATARSLQVSLATHDQRIRRSRLAPVWRP